MQKKSVYIEILSLTNGLVILFLLTGNKWFLYVSVAVAIGSIFIPAFASFLGGLLRKFIKVLGEITNTIILAIVYVFILTPIALLYRLFGRARNARKNAASHFIQRDHSYKPDDFTRQW